ncbi:hypothetical protein D3C84_423530 [compost metagenome]
MLPGLGPERAQVRRDDHAGDDLDVGLFERGNLRGKIIGQALKATRVDQLKALLRQYRRETELLVAPRIAVAVIGEQAADDFVGRHRPPHGAVSTDHIFQAPEKVVSPFETLLRLAATGKEPRLPRRHRGDARDFVDFALVGHRVGGFRGRRHQHQIDLVRENQLARHFRRAVGVGLAVLDDDLQAIGLAGHGDRVLQDLLERLDDVVVGCRKGRQRPGLRADITELDHPLAANGKVERQAGQCHAAGSHAGTAQEITAGEVAAKQVFIVVVCHVSTPKAWTNRVATCGRAITQGQG